MIENSHTSLYSKLNCSLLLQLWSVIGTRPARAMIAKLVIESNQRDGKSDASNPRGTIAICERHGTEENLPSSRVVNPDPGRFS